MRKQGKEAHQPRVRKQMHQLGDREVHHMTERKRLEPRDRRALHLQIGREPAVAASREAPFASGLG